MIEGKTIVNQVSYFRINQAKATFQKVKLILFNKSVSLNIRKRVLKCYLSIQYNYKYNYMRHITFW